MDRYIDITIKKDPEFSPGFIMNTLVSKLHLALVQLKSNHIGVSFPRIPQTSLGLGRVLRIHGQKRDLDDLMKKEFLHGLTDHVRIIGPDKIPQIFRTVAVRRKQTKSNPERIRRRLARRLARRENIGFDEAMKKIPMVSERHLKLPFLQFKSQSTGQFFRLFIEQKIVDGKPIDGKFNCFGISQDATLPWF